MNLHNYRAWNIKSKQMRYNAQDDIVDISERPLSKILGKEAATFFEIAEHDNNIVLMRYTGIDDEDKKPIYFGDIIIFTFKDKSVDELETGTALVTETMSYGAGILREKDPDNLFGMVVAVEEAGYIDEIWDDDDLWRFKVIGNRFENPELIKKIDYKQI